MVQLYCVFLAQDSVPKSKLHVSEIHQLDRVPEAQAGRSFCFRVGSSRCEIRRIHMRTRTHIECGARIVTLTLLLIECTRVCVCMCMYRSSFILAASSESEVTEWMEAIKGARVGPCLFRSTCFDVASAFS